MQNRYIEQSMSVYKTYVPSSPSPSIVSKSEEPVEACNSANDLGLKEMAGFGSAMETTAARTL
jgi:hypothetical protein